MKKIFAFASIFLSLNACSSPISNPSILDGGTSNDGASASDGGSASEDIVLTMDTFQVGPGEETFRCQNFKNPFGADAEVREWQSDMTGGSHHLLVFYKDNAQNEALETCSGLEFASGPYGAQTPHATMTYPAGVGARIAANTGLRFASHYLNATAQTITAEVKLTIRRAPQGTVQNRAGVFFFNNLLVYVPPTQQPHTISKTCTIPHDLNFIFATGHMHRFATNLTATVSGQTIYSTDSWDNSPFKEFSPALFLTKGTQVTFTCTYVNTTGQALTFGESAQTNEMCIFDGQYYPDPTGNGFGC